MTFSWRFVVVAGIFVTTLVVSNIIAVKLVEVSGRVFDAGNILFPLAYLLGDVLTEVYGFKAARRIIILGFACNLLAVGAIQVAIARCPPPASGRTTRRHTRPSSGRRGESSPPRSAPIWSAN